MVWYGCIKYNSTGFCLLKITKQNISTVKAKQIPVSKKANNPESIISPKPDVVACICNPAKRRLNGPTVRVQIPSGE